MLLCSENYDSITQTYLKFHATGVPMSNADHTSLLATDELSVFCNDSGPDSLNTENANEQGLFYAHVLTHQRDTSRKEDMPTRSSLSRVWVNGGGEGRGGGGGEWGLTLAAPVPRFSLVVMLAGCSTSHFQFQLKMAS